MATTTAPVPSGELQHVRDLARALDSQFRIPGTNRTYGLDAVIGLLPGVGDVAGLAMSAGLILRAVTLGARGATVGRMVLNATIDGVVGTVPVLGTLFDFVFKANNRNVALLEQHVLDPAATRTASRRSIRRTILLVVAAFVVVIAVVIGIAAALLTWLT